MEIDSETLCAIAESLHMGDESVLKQLFELLYDRLLYFANQYVSQITVAEDAVADYIEHDHEVRAGGENRRFFDLVRWDRLGWVDTAELLEDPDAV
ncbi:hypothetical protein ACFOET_08550 [Parapedobacter deserti]|uniref:Uncharacterized protein n=1 Tax=Parapedobacter deserti TaxID=1912957 RepID=A0ABV7JHS6_9SPHI